MNRANQPGFSLGSGSLRELNRSTDSPSASSFKRFHQWFGARPQPPISSGNSTVVSSPYLK